MNWPAPEGQTFIRKCRTHFHLCATCLIDDEPDTLDLSGCLTLQQATTELLRRH